LDKIHNLQLILKDKFGYSLKLGMMVYFLTRFKVMMRTDWRLVSLKISQGDVKG
jgi:hypothetical protein